MKMNPEQHARAAMQMAFDAFYEDKNTPSKIDASGIRIGFQPLWFSTVWNANTVMFSSGLRESLALPVLNEGMAKTVVHECQHIVQARFKLVHGNGWSTRKWIWFYIRYRSELEREAEEMADRFWEQVK